ncbi:adenosine kinase [Falsirhodobacter sp. 20TX0035]|uniref:adenosine kinase n=1 Tax=Falsirhodobacter sp. 20TX0035 TaxID=3022019 RepID=UPI00232C1704|nr:adenosine kinase [Falsirhodobacter sp. 20TX0035]MDB6452252.1 adenosine kinase [Falsirhodobacter sp. 20TX0035]
MKKYHVTGIGNAMVDVLARTDDAFLQDHGIGKGVMQLIDRDRAVELYAHIGPAREVSGGSAANTIAGIAHLGGPTAYIGKVRDDQLGAIFAHDLRAQGATFETPMASRDTVQETGRCLVCVTPDGERSMNTYLGVSEFLGPEDIDVEMVAQSEWIYLEGYRFDGPDSHAAFEKAIRACKAAGGRVALTLSDPFCVDRHRDAFRRLIEEDVDLLFANRAEILSMYGTDDLDTALAAAAAQVGILACTDSEKGAHVLSGGQRWHIPALPTEIQDATGAGDLFAAGFLWGITNGHGLEEAGRMGCIAASEIISHVGARPEQDLKALFHQHGLL